MKKVYLLIFMVAIVHCIRDRSDAIHEFPCVDVLWYTCNEVTPCEGECMSIFDCPVSTEGTGNSHTYEEPGGSQYVNTVVNEDDSHIQCFRGITCTCDIVGDEQTGTCTNSGQGEWQYTYSVTGQELCPEDECANGDGGNGDGGNGDGGNGDGGNGDGTR